jgi:nucleotidyltransferase/DNA polymerase involved in DNA repair
MRHLPALCRPISRTGAPNTMPPSSNTPQKVIFHVDMDAFYAAVEQRDNPLLRGKPVIVGALPGKRGVVSTASYEARKFGVRSAMPINEAHRRCPQGTFLFPRFPIYSAESRRVMETLRSFSPAVEPISIDEAFVDMTGTEKLWGAPQDAAAEIARCIREVTDGLTASIGIAPNKFLAKLASDIQKPSGITQTPFCAEEIYSWLAPLSVSRIWGVGVKTQQVLQSWGIETIGDLQKLGRHKLLELFGKQGGALHSLARGFDSRDVGEREPVKSVSREHTFNRDSYNRDEWKQTLLSLASDVGRRARARGLQGNTVVLSYRTPDFQRRSRRQRLEHPTNISKDIYEQACSLLEALPANVQALRLIGVGITGFAPPVQTSLFEGTDAPEKQRWKVSEEAMDRLTERFGRSAILRAAQVDTGKQGKPRGSSPNGKR